MEEEEGGRGKDRRGGGRIGERGREKGIREKRNRKGRGWNGRVEGEGEGRGGKGRGVNKNVESRIECSSLFPYLSHFTPHTCSFFLPLASSPPSP